MVQVPVTDGNRVTRVEFDLGEQVAVVAPWGGTRSGQQIAQAVSSNRGRDGQYSNGMRFWEGPGCWTLQPIQEKNHRFHEMLPPGLTENDFAMHDADLQAVIRDHSGGALVQDTTIISYWELKAILAYAPMRGLPGAFVINEDINPGVGPAGDYFNWYRLPTSGPNAITYEDAVFQHPPQNVEAATGLLSLPAPATRLFPIVYGSVPMRADQGLFFRWCVPGTPNQYPDYIVNVWFGQYCVAIKGDGTALLLEYCRAAGSQVYRWQHRFTWQYCNPSQVLNTTHTLEIMPLLDRWGGKWLTFCNCMISEGGVYGGAVVSGGLFSGSSNNSEVSWKADDISRNFDQDESPGHVTREGPFRIDHRRDVRVSWHASFLIFAAQGYVTDQPFETRTSTFNLDGVPFDYTLTGRLPTPSDGYSIAISIFDAINGDQYLPNNPGTWENVTNPYATILLTAPTLGSGTVPIGTKISQQAASDTPVFYGYSFRQDALTRTISPGLFTATNIRQFHSNGGDYALQSAKAGLTLSDPTNVLTKLHNRGELSCRVVMNWYPYGAMTPIDTVLFRGYASKSLNTVIGSPDPAFLRSSNTVQGLPEGAGFQGPPRVFPDPEWGTFSIAIAGMWRRLAADETNLRKAGLFQNFALDPNATNPDGSPINANPGAIGITWKITDAIAYLLKQAGFPDTMIQIPDITTRFPMSDEIANDHQLEIGFYTDFLEAVQRLAVTFLQAVVIFDENIGTDGAWTLLINPGAEGQTPVFSFTTYPLGDGFPPHMPGMYPQGSGWLAYPFEKYPFPPDINHVIVTPGLISGDFLVNASSDYYEQTNPVSYPVPGLESFVDPTSPHYIGREHLAYYIDPMLQDVDHGTTYNNCAAVGTRLMQFSGRGGWIIPGVCPLYCIHTTDLLGNPYWRPLRFGDPVTVNGDVDWFVRSVSAVIDTERGGDEMQMATVELQKLAPLI